MELTTWRMTAGRILREIDLIRETRLDKLPEHLIHPPSLSSEQIFRNYGESFFSNRTFVQLAYRKQHLLVVSLEQE